MGVQPTYAERNAMRSQRLDEATMAFVAYFMGLGDDLATAESKVSQLSSEVAAYIYPYILGNVEIIAQINASDLAFMDAAAKEFITNALTV
jgi:hypothetical protein